MFGAMLKYFFLGSSLGIGDRAMSLWFREGRTRNQQAAQARALRYLLQNYQPQSFEEDCTKPEYKAAFEKARAYYQTQGTAQTEAQLKRLLGQLEGTAPARVGLWEKCSRVLGRERINGLPLRKKAILAAAVALVLDVWVLLTGGLGAGFGALLASILEIPALLLGLMAGPTLGRLIDAARGAGTKENPLIELRNLDAELQKNKRSLHLRLIASQTPASEKHRLSQ